MAADDQGDLSQQELDIGVTAKRFQMQSFRSCTGEWIPIDTGAAGHMWRPRATAVDAAAKCLTWTGLVGLPAMQVIDMETGEVVWRFSDQYPQAGESITLPAADEQLAWKRARTGIAEHNPRPSIDAGGGQLQISLFELPDRE